MIKIVEVNLDAKIIFSADETLFNVELLVLDDNFESEILITKFEKIESGVNYYISIRDILVPHLKKTYIKLIDSSNNEYRKNLDFPSNLLEGYSLIGNSCVAWRIYEIANTPYNSPTIGNLILDDEEYIRFCENIETYLNAKMIIGDTKGNINFKKHSGHPRVVNPKDNIIPDYPISHHLDVEIHWIHTRNKKLEFNRCQFNFTENLFERIEDNTFIEKWERRAKRGEGTKRICLWSSSGMFNPHGEWERSQLIDRFKKLPVRSIFLTERKEEEYEDDLHVIRYVPEWEGNHQELRNSVGFVKWDNQEENAKRFLDIIKEKFL